jgi:hypothetical protein
MAAIGVICANGSDSSLMERTAEQHLGVYVAKGAETQGGRSARGDNGMRQGIHLLAASALVLISSISAVAQESNVTRPIALILQPVRSEITVGQVPQFRLMLSNATDRIQRVLNIANRIDLQHTYCNLVVAQNGGPLSLPRAISDPGPISEADWIDIRPGTTKTFLLANFPDAFDQLPPGVYEAHVEFWQNPYESHKTRYASNSATFTVKK